MIAAFVLVLAAAFAPAAAAQQSPSPAGPTQPFAPSWGMIAGWDVFAKKGCGKCHAIRGFGGHVGPDLGRIQAGESFFDLGAAMWNHLPRMGEKMREVRIERLLRE